MVRDPLDITDSIALQDERVMICNDLATRRANGKANNQGNLHNLFAEGCDPKSTPRGPDSDINLIIGTKKWCSAIMVPRIATTCNYVAESNIILMGFEEQGKLAS